MEGESFSFFCSTAASESEIEMSDAFGEMVTSPQGQRPERVLHGLRWRAPSS